MSATPETSIEIYNNGNIAVTTETSWLKKEPKNGIKNYICVYRERIRENFPSIIALRHSLVRDKFHQDTAYYASYAMYGLGFGGGWATAELISYIANFDNSFIPLFGAFLGGFSARVIDEVYQKATKHRLAIVDSQVEKFNSQVEKFQKIFPTVKSEIKPVRYSVRDYLHSFDINLPKLPFRR